jgi:hypothetical protein
MIYIWIYPTVDSEIKAPFGVLVIDSSNDYKLIKSSTKDKKLIIKADEIECYSILTSPFSLNKDNRIVIKDDAKVIAYERTGSFVYRSFTDCCNEFGIRYVSSLKKLIESGGTAPDGYTTFDIV